MTYGDLSREEIERIIDNPNAMALLRNNYDKAMLEFSQAVDADIARMFREEYPSIK